MTDEILVHISTPATRQNDDLYLSLAAAYQDFEPQTRLGYESRQQLTIDGASAPSQQGSNLLMMERAHNNDAGRSSIVSTSKESYGSFPSLLSSDGPPNNSRSISMISGLPPAEDDSVPTSSRLARLDRLHQHWKKQKTPRSSFVGQPTSSGRTPQSSPGHVDTTFADTTFIEDTQLGAQALQSQLQDNYSMTSEDTSEDEDGSTALEEPRTVLDRPSESTSEKTAGQTLELSREGPTPAILMANTPQLDHPRLDHIPGPSLPVTHPSPKKRQIPSNGTASPNLYDFRRLPIDVYSLPPKISVERPGKLPSQVTRHLAAIKAQNPKRFKSVRKAEKPRFDDRGYWSIPCSKWPSKNQHDFWLSLSEHISSGRLGWGVTLHREGSSGTLGTVRLYCWAELIEHTWLLLWLSSHGEIAKSGSNWINADGKVVYEVS